MVCITLFINFLIYTSLIGLTKSKKYKKTRSEAIASNESPSKGSASQRLEFFSGSVVGTLSKECKWLSDLLDTKNDDEPISITWDVSQFHNTPGETPTIWVSKEDISQFLSGSRLNISIIQLFMK